MKRSASQGSSQYVELVKRSSGQEKSWLVIRDPTTGIGNHSDTMTAQPTLYGPFHLDIMLQKSGSRCRQATRDVETIQVIHVTGRQGP